MIFARFLASADVARVLDERAFVQAMLDVEAGLARAAARAGAIPAAAAGPIAAACDARDDAFDVDALVAEGARAGSLAIPLVKRLTAAVARRDAAAASFVHWGATSQDVLDTAQVLVARRALALVDRDLAALVAGLLALADRHGGAPVLARTLLQPAQVTSLDFKLAAWIAPLVRAQARLHTAGARALQLQLGGAVGTRAAMGAHGDAIVAALAEALALRAPEAAWHVQRDEWVGLGCELGLVAGSLGKVAKDVSLMAQGEVAELAEPSGAGRGGSSAMPHKRNPVGSMVALAAALRAPQHVAALLAAMPQAHERGLGDWQAELAEFGPLVAAVHGALAALVATVDGLHVDTARMARNIEATQGLVFAEALALRLADRLGKPAAQARVEALSRRAVDESRTLADVARAELGDAIPAGELAALFDPARAAAHAGALARRQLDTLAEAADALRRAAPWRSWLPPTEEAG
jgi:3-carboxy-cis,cis-muconate cycloisomerase